MISNGAQILYGAWTVSAGYLYTGCLEEMLKERPNFNKQMKTLFYASVSALWMRSASMQFELALKASLLGNRTSYLGILRWVATLTPFLTFITAQKLNQLRHLTSLPVVVAKVSDGVIVAASCYLCLTREHRLMAISTLACRSICFAYNRTPLTNKQKICRNLIHLYIITLGCLFLGNTIQKIFGVVSGVLLLVSIYYITTQPTEIMGHQSQIADLAKLMGAPSPSSTLSLNEQYEELKKYANKTFALTHHPDRIADPLKHEQFKQVQELLQQLESAIEPEGLTIPLDERVRILTHTIAGIQIALKERRERIMMWEEDIARNAPPPHEDELSDMESVVKKLGQCLS